MPGLQPWNVGVWEDPDSRWSPIGCTVHGAHNSTTTALAVDVTDGVGWTHGDGDFSIVVSGEEMTVTAAGAVGATQTLTVTRSVNGVTKSHSDGEAVELLTPVFYGL